ncbi:hypothetical protein CM19_12155 [Candidatus Acidianus copahuensis]|uniref:DUF2029 domain-containing protein n=1 Tax=Candidatus Acidianus copahuensis TaxID=1160895 RepID=A0A031LLS9_9CREN|nr:hypothetical protein [Candidatus Acidianus copahuensis]EZQ01818.1 hypothetical protein CM19_12155 [Candidatus Acidianus copahuensis]
MAETRRQVIYLTVGLVIMASLFILAYRINILENPISAAILSLSFFSVIAIFIIALNPWLINRDRRIDKIDDIVVIISILTYTIISISTIKGFGTDDMEYITQADRYLLLGKDPYAQLYSPIGVSPTYLLSGSVAHAFIYPPLSFLVYFPFFLIFSHFLMLSYLNLINIIAQDLLVTLIYFQGKKTGDPIAVLPVIFSFITAGLLAPSFSGVNAPVWALFMAMSYITKGKKSGIFMALADSFNQIPWIITPFLLIYKRKDVKDILFGFIVSILVINLPFLFWNAHAFLSVFTDDSSTIPVAFTGLTIFNLTSFLTVEPWFFTITMGLIGIFCLYMYFRLFSLIKETIWVFPMIILWFSWRTLTSYFLMWPELMFLSIFNLEKEGSNKISLNFNVIRKELIASLFIFMFTLTSVGAISHVQYVSQDPIKVVSVSVPEESNPVSELSIIVKNTRNESVNITLIRVSVPNSLNMVWNFTNSSIPPNSTREILAYTNNPKLFINSSSFTVQVYSGYFMSSYQVDINSTKINLTYENSTSTGEIGKN